MAFQLPTYTEQGQAMLDEFRARARKLSVFLATKAVKDHGYFHDNGKWAYVITRDVDHICATPVCALGWAVDQGICEGASIQPFLLNRGDAESVGFSAEELSTRRVFDGSGKAHYNVATDDKNRAEAIIWLDKRTRYADRYDAGVITEVVMDNEVRTWEYVGKLFFGAVIHKLVFSQGDASLDQVLERLVQFAEQGYISLTNADEVEYVLDHIDTSIYFLDKEDMNTVSKYYIHADGTEGDFQ